MTLEQQNITLESASLHVQGNQTKTNSSTAFSKLHLPTYFVDIRVENYAGLVTYSKSDAVLIDTTPPHIEYVKCMDPTYSSDESIQFLGNNNSVSVTWEAGEDVSGIVSTCVSIGTAPGLQDIRADIFVSVNKSLTINGLGGKLIHMHQYFVNVEVENGAGQKTMKSCNFTMDILPPDTLHAVAASMFSESNTSSNEEVELTRYTDRIGLEWDDKSITGAQYYEWKIGSSSERHDIFPLMRIGKKQAKSVGIVAGEMRLDGIQKNPGLGEFFERNMTNVKNVKQDRKKNQFKLEPGRCIYQSLYAVSRSHLHSKIRSNPLCIKRKKDKLIKPGIKRVVVNDNGEVFVESPTKLNHKPALAVNIDVDDGGLSVGVLDETDVQSLYGSTASADYHPYIADPDLTSHQLSRFLKQRLISTMKPMFYLAPIPTVKLRNKINVAKPYDKSSLKERTEVDLLYWDNGDQSWRSVQESCGLGNQASVTSSSFENEVCEDIFSDAQVTFLEHGRDKRSTESLSSPRHFLIAVVNTSLSNSIPSIVTTNIEGKEDNVLEAKIDFSDADGDNLTFTIKSQPLHGTANISHNGILNYMPERDFTGVDQLEISAVEVIDAPAITPHELSAVISITVENVNDAPTLFFENSSKSLLNSEESDAVNIELTNEHTKHLVGTFWMADIDNGDFLSYHNKFPEHSSLNFTLVPQPPQDQEYAQDIVGSFGTVSRQQLWLYHLSNYTGSTNVSFIIVDQDNAFSRPIIIQVRVNPHGDPKVDGGLSAVIIAVLVVFGVILLVATAAISLRYYMNVKNKISDVSDLPDHVFDNSPKVRFTNTQSDLKQQDMFRRRFDHGSATQRGEPSVDITAVSPRVTTPDVRHIKLDTDMVKVDI
ncbi:uncharacterized protein LOC121367704 [Gigantopelta aegis]|uniref:uncharacterized protein LOC121367704 n=1 Tax=Gigantopelta aegis TaxID=1735272 RepID=UPI001B888A74|nr:uncharacterized protein LOC121367704 [Gigantopelta aegis]